MDEISIKIGNRIKQIRQRKDISQEELALAANLNKAFVGQIERGQKNATIKTIEKVCFALDVTLHEFFSFELDEVDLHSDSLIKVSSMLKQLDDKQVSQILDIMKKIIELKNS